jgi:hypothetical protein
MFDVGLRNMTKFKLNLSARFLPWVALILGVLTIIVAVRQPLQNESPSSYAMFCYILGGITALGGFIGIFRCIIGFWIIFGIHLIQIIQYTSPEYRFVIVGPTAVSLHMKSDDHFFQINVFALVICILAIRGIRGIRGLGPQTGPPVVLARRQVIG